MDGHPSARRRSTRTGLRRRAARLYAPGLLAACLCVLTAALVFGAAACSRDGGEGEGGNTTLATGRDTSGDEDIEGHVGEEIEVGDAVVTVRALQAAFQPAMPTQRLSDETPVAPATGETFYQAYVRVQNNGDKPLRADAKHFTCAVGTAVVKIEPTRSGPAARSLIGGTSLDFLLTFKAEAGYEPILIYRPPWYGGAVRIGPAVEATTTTT